MTQETRKIRPRNLSAQLSYRGRGNPPVAHPSSAISNCFPGLEFDFRNIWRRILVGIVLTEFDNYVAAVEDPALDALKGTRLLTVDGHKVAVQTKGPIFPGRLATLDTAANPDAVSFMEWSNTVALLVASQGRKVACVFTSDKADVPVLPGKAGIKTQEVALEVRHIFERSQAPGEADQPLAVLAAPLAQPGELSQGLCSPWQNDYRECACYYWAASRPDYVDIVPTEDGLSRGDNWMQREQTGRYLPDDRASDLTLSYDDLFREWEKVLKFVVKGRREP